MTRFIIDNKIDNSEDIHEFNLEGYKYSAKESTPDKPVFKRKQS